MILESKSKCFGLPKKTTITLKGEVYTHIKGMLWSSHQMCSVKKVFVETSQNSQENTCAKVSFFNKGAGLRSATLIKKRLLHRCFPVNFKLFIYNIFFSFILVFLTSFFVIVSYLEVAACRCSSKCFSKFRKIHRNNLMLDCLILIKLQAWISATLSKKKNDSEIGAFL